MMRWRCEATGELRAYLDGELAPGDRERVRRHLAECLRCRRELAALRADATAVEQALATTASRRAPDPASSLAAFRTRLDRTSRTSDFATRRLPTMVINRFRVWQRAALAAGVALLILAGLATTPGGASFAQGFLQLFRVQRLAVVTIDPNQPMKGLIDLSRLGEVSGPTSGVRTQSAATAAEANRIAGFQVKLPARLPASVADTPRFEAWAGQTTTFTFRQDKARAYLTSIGETKFALPPKFDGARLVVGIPSAVLVQYPGRDGTAAGGAPSGIPGLLVGQAQSPTAEVQGNVALAELRDFLLSVPGLPADTVAQLRAINDWTTTLPIPVPRDRAAWHDVTVNGAPGLALADNTGLGGAVIWPRDGYIYLVGGMLTERELLEVAHSLR